MSDRVTEYPMPRPMTAEQILEIDGRIQAGDLYDENELLDVAEDLIATVRAAQQDRDEVLEHLAELQKAHDRNLEVAAGLRDEIARILDEKGRANREPSHE